MSVNKVVDLLQRRIGLSQEGLGLSGIRLAVEVRMRILEISEVSDYADYLKNNPVEFEVLTDALVVPETWFFRGGVLFRYLSEQVAKAARPAVNPYRILSVPCSTGEEPYSLAIALKEACLPETAWTLEAVDLCQRHLEIAREGRYSEFSFRQTEPELRQTYFLPVHGKWILSADIRERVRFREGNLIDPRFLINDAPYDLILCRNAFIYFHIPARRQALAALDRLLVPGGLLAMGYAEPLHPIDARFQSVGPTECFLYRRTVPNLRSPIMGLPAVDTWLNFTHAGEFKSDRTS